MDSHRRRSRPRLPDVRTWRAGLAAAFGALLVCWHAPAAAPAATLPLIPEYRGVNAQHMFGGDSDDMAGWGIDMVRETVHWFDRVPMATGSVAAPGGSTLHNLQGVANANRRNGLLTMFTPFSWNGAEIRNNTPSQTAYWSGYQARLGDMARQFKGQNDVWLGVWNEPYAWDRPTSSTTWLSDMKTIVGTIRATGATNTIVIPGGQNAGEEAVLLAKGRELIDFDPQHNVVYDLHAYNGWFDDGQAGIEARIDGLLTANIPFLFGEFGWATPGGNFDVAPFLRAAAKKRVGALAWIWESADANHLINGDGSWNSTAANHFWTQQVYNYTTGERLPVPEPATAMAVAGGAVVLLLRPRPRRTGR